MIHLPIPARLAFNLFFFAAGIGLGAWAACLPVLAAQNGLDKGQLGLVLLCFALGAILLMVNVGHMTARFDSGSISFVGAIVFSAALMTVPHVEGRYWLALTVFVAGASCGTLDVAMNTGASALERQLGRYIMSSFHGVFSVGNLAGAFLVGQLLWQGGSLAVCLGATGVVVACLATIAALGARSGAAQRRPARTAAGKPLKLDPAVRPKLYLLGVIAFLALLAEGGVMDWSAVYIVTVFSAADSIGAYGYAVFASTMALGRFTGDWIAAKVGSTQLLLGCALLCTASITLLIMAPNLTLVFVALALAGLGVANIVPALFAEAGRAGGPAVGRAMSIVTSMGYAGLLLGPALLGFVAQALSLSASFGLVALAFLLVGAGSRIIKRF